MRLLSTLFDGRTSRLPPGQEWLAVVFLVAFLIGIARVALDRVWSTGACRMAIGCGTTLSALLIVAAFLVNRNIFNSDNYRYLIFLLTPWSLGFGLLVDGLSQTRAVRPRGRRYSGFHADLRDDGIDVPLVSR